MTSILDDDGFGGAFDDDYRLQLLPKKQRRIEIIRRRKNRDRWQRALEVRERWTSEMFAEEEARLAAEVAAMVKERRDAA